MFNLWSDIELVHGAVSECDGRGLGQAGGEAGGDVRAGEAALLSAPNATLHEALRLRLHYHRCLPVAVLPHRETVQRGQLHEPSVVGSLGRYSNIDDQSGVGRCNYISGDCLKCNFTE